MPTDFDERNRFLRYQRDAGIPKHRIRWNWLVDLPFGKGRKYLAGASRAADLIVGGWQANGIVTFSTGQPFTFRSQNCVASFNSCRPDAVSGKQAFQAPAGGRTPDQWFDITAFASPAPGTGGNLGPQMGYGPGIRNVDFSLFKDIRLNERYRIQFRSEWLNLSNTPRFAVGGIQQTQGNSAFGRLTSTLPGTARNVQLALRFMF